MIGIDLRVLVISLAISHGACTGQSHQAPTSAEVVVTTFCDIVHRSNRFSGRRVRFRASVISDGIEHTALADPKCKPHIVLRISVEASDRVDVQRFRDAIFVEKPRGAAYKRVSATFTGTFLWDRQIRALKVEEITELTVTPLQEKTSKPSKEVQ